MKASTALFIAAELALVLGVMHFYHIEEVHGLTQLLPLIFVGFVVHLALPERFRVAFFVLLSWGALWFLLGSPHTFGLIGLGLALLGVCHLPVSFRLRVGLLALAAAGMAVLRLGWLAVPGWGAFSEVIVPLVASFFMLRLFLYLYELRYDPRPATVWQRIGYFFMLPNLCFPLFPVVDFRAFRDGRPADRTALLATAQRGVLWMFRGVTHLLLYRVVYYYLVPAPDAVASLGGVVAFVVGVFLLLLRISGLFHLAVGLLGIFGFALPLTHRRYLVADSVLDFWRRLNIYWRDMLARLVFFPVFVRLRGRPMAVRVGAAVAVVFAASALLNAYQWFWLKGTFHLTGLDLFFWTAVGAASVVGALREARPGGKAVRQTGWAHGGRIAGVMAGLVLLWSLWASGGFGAWLGVLAAATAGPWWGLLVLAAGVAVFALVADRLHHPRGRYALAGRTRFAPAGLLVGGTALVLVLLVMPPVQARVDAQTGGGLTLLTTDRFNQRDAELGYLGYYEDLLAPDDFLASFWQVLARRPADWSQTLVQAGAAERTDDLLGYTLRPSVSQPFKRVLLQTNAWGMRDRDYTREKPPGTFRIAVVGASIVMGWGVTDEQTFENRVEDRLNAEHAGERYQKYELLNFSVSGYVLPQMVRLIETQVCAFAPDVLFLRAHSDYDDTMINGLIRRIQARADLNYPELQAIVDAAGVTAETPYPEAMERLVPHAEDITRWAFTRAANACPGARTIWLDIPDVKPAKGRDWAASRARMTEIVEDVGVPTMCVCDAYEGYNPKHLWLAPWDAHINAAAHQLIADGLYDLMVARRDEIGW